ncbi:MAG: hypothetical protein KatS3mg124_1731 [Porticoccaceae bacterium]|nr:MAG: hypothetical protein KatS3mg124_1731 [Porticoccaceae bacterium]
MVAGAEDPAAREACRELVEHDAHLVDWIDGEGLAALLWEEVGEPVKAFPFGRCFFGVARRQARRRIVSLAFRMHGLRRFPAAPEDPALAWAEALEAPQPLHWRLP